MYSFYYCINVRQLFDSMLELRKINHPSLCFRHIYFSLTHKCVVVKTSSSRKQHSSSSSSVATPQYKICRALCRAHSELSSVRTTKSTLNSHIHTLKKAAAAAQPRTRFIWFGFFFSWKMYAHKTGVQWQFIKSCYNFAFFTHWWFVCAYLWPWMVHWAPGKIVILLEVGKRKYQLSCVLCVRCATNFFTIAPPQKRGYFKDGRPPCSLAAAAAVVVPIIYFFFYLISNF